MHKGMRNAVIRTSSKPTLSVPNESEMPSEGNNGIVASVGAKVPSVQAGNIHAKPIATKNVASEPMVAIHFAKLEGAHKIATVAIIGIRRRR